MKARINKYLADCGISSRRKSEGLIKEGRVSVNNQIITEFNIRIDPTVDVVTLDGERIKPRKNLYYILNKPKGVITSVTDNRNRQTVVDLLNVRERIYPVGRLDYDSTGLIFLTNDGEFSQLLTHPGNKVPREYEIKLDIELKEDDKKRLINGVMLDGIIGKFIRVNYLSQKDKKFIKVVCEEGRNKFVKRMFGKLGCHVKSLNRVSYAGIRLNVPSGKYRKLTPSELQIIKEKYSY